VIYHLYNPNLTNEVFNNAILELHSSDPSHPSQPSTLFQVAKEMRTFYKLRKDQERIEAQDVPVPEKLNAQEEYDKIVEQVNLMPKSLSIDPGPGSGGSRRRTVHRKRKSHHKSKSKRVRQTRRKQSRRHRHSRRRHH
jgi:hypothetical protein